MTEDAIELNAPAFAAERTASPGLAERQVLRSLSAFQHGCLRLVYPDGRVRTLGRTDTEPRAEMRLRRPASFFRRCALYGNIGFGEAYVDGDWDTDSIRSVIAWFIANIARTPSLRGSSQRLAFTNLLRIASRVGHWLRPNSIRTSRRNIARHYDLGNDFYSLWLDKTMTYSAARFTGKEQTLEEAQHEKYEALCRRLQLKPSDHILEIGCGWGGFSEHAAKHHGCRITAVTISREQFDYATARIARSGMAHRVEIRLEDYRCLDGQFDKIASIEMLEAVGDRYLETFFAQCQRLLKADGLMAMQFITVPDSQYEGLRKGVDWIQKHIFPGSLLLSMARVGEALGRTGEWCLHELEDLGASYSRTLRLWWEQFNARVADVRALGFDDRFIRKWNYYLQYCEAAFEERHISVVQACWTRPGNGSLRAAWQS
jgi:cyclopropane-fatty-acyl-phospholipid synthase